MTPLPSTDDFDAYLVWRDQQVCRGCGAAFKDRPRDAAGVCLDQWATETECMTCYSKRCQPSESAEPLKADQWAKVKRLTNVLGYHPEGGFYIASEVDAAHAADTATIAELEVLLAQASQASMVNRRAWLESQDVVAAHEATIAALRRQIESK